MFESIYSYNSIIPYNRFTVILFVKSLYFLKFRAQKNRRIQAKDVNVSFNSTCPQVKGRMINGIINMVMVWREVKPLTLILYSTGFSKEKISVYFHNKSQKTGFYFSF